MTQECKVASYFSHCVMCTLEAMEKLCHCDCKLFSILELLDLGKASNLFMAWWPVKMLSELVLGSGQSFWSCLSHWRQWKNSVIVTANSSPFLNFLIWVKLLTCSWPGGQLKCYLNWFWGLGKVSGPACHILFSFITSYM